MNRFTILGSLLFISLFFSIKSDAIENETLNYKIVYRWGIINKQAGRASITLSKINNGMLKAKMCARTEPWADHFYRVRDTLYSTFSSKTYLPINYIRIAHENGSYAKDVLKINQGVVTTADINLYRCKKNSNDTTTTTNSLSTVGPAVDLLSSLYYLRTLRFSNLTVGEKSTITIFSGKRKEQLHFIFNGPKTIDFDGKKTRVLEVEFTFTSDSGKTTSDPIKAWLTDDSSHIPLKIEGKLKIGKVQAIFTNKT